MKASFTFSEIDSDEKELQMRKRESEWIIRKNENKFYKKIEWKSFFHQWTLLLQRWEIMEIFRTKTETQSVV